MYHTTQTDDLRVILLQSDSCNCNVSLIAQVLAVSLRIIGERVLLVSDSTQTETGMLSASSSKISSAEFNRIHLERTANWHQLTRAYDFIVLDSVEGCDTVVDDFILVLPDDNRELLHSFGFFSTNLQQYLGRPLYLLMSTTAASTTAESNEDSPLTVFTNLSRQWFGVSPPCLGQLPELHAAAEGDSAPTESADLFVDVIRNAAVFLRSSRLPLISWQQHFCSHRKSDIMDLSN